jgi:hypothetical protein
MFRVFRLRSTVPTDVFISHASEDKASVAKPLGDALIRRGWNVWLDELALTVGDSLSRHIDAVLAECRFGVVVLSRSFFAKEWPQRELAGLVAREIDAKSKIILPVWHGIDHHYIVERAPTLADRIGAPTDAGIEDVANKISLAMGAGLSASASSSAQAADAVWRGILGGETPAFEGAHTIGADGRRGQIVYALGPRSALVRLEDDTIARVKPG